MLLAPGRGVLWIRPRTGQSKRRQCVMDKPLCILPLEDDFDVAELVKAMLEQKPGFCIFRETQRGKPL